MTRRLAGAVASCLVLLSGLWLILAPFALGIQPKGVDWKHETFTDVWSGIGLGVVGLIGVLVFAAAITRSLRDHGVFGTTDAAEPAERAPEPSAPTAGPPASDLDKLLAPLVQALSEDLAHDRRSREQADGADKSTAEFDGHSPVNTASPVTNGRAVLQGVNHQAPAHQVNAGHQVNADEEEGR